MTDTGFREEILAELTGNICPFWRERVRAQNTHFVEEMDAQGRVASTPSHSLILAARLLWAYSAFYRWSQDTRDLALARQAYDSIRTEFADPVHGGYVWALDANRQIEHPHKNIYGQACCIYALTEYYLATDHSAAQDAAVELFKLVEQNGRDSARGGYFGVCHADWSLPDKKRLNSVDQAAPKSMNTQLRVLEAYTNLLRIRPDDQVQQSLDDLLLVFNRRIANDDKSHLHQFFEENWTVCSDNYTYGHDIEASWLLCEAANVLENPKRAKMIASLAKKLARATIDEGLGPDGGLFHEGRNGRPTDRSKIWWVQAEGVVGLLNMLELTGDRQYQRATSQVWQFIRQHVVDHQHGEWHSRITPGNQPDLSLPKVSARKSPYHNGRMCLEVLRRTQADGA